MRLYVINMAVQHSPQADGLQKAIHL